MASLLFLFLGALAELGWMSCSATRDGLLKRFSHKNSIFNNRDPTCLLLLLMWRHEAKSLALHNLVRDAIDGGILLRTKGFGRERNYSEIS